MTDAYDESQPPAIVVVGATATGKSALALVLAERLDAEIVNADAMQFYRGMDIGTAKLPVAERRGIPHHHLDTHDVTEEAAVAQYQDAARATVRDIHARGRRAVVVGGSGLYVRALVDHLEFPPTDPEVRARLEARAQAEGPGMLHRELAELDPQAGADIDPRNARRVVRALEVIELTGQPYSATMPRREYAIPAVQIGLDLGLETLDARIGRRVDAMWDLGLVDEVRHLVTVGLRDGVTARRAVGYAEVLRMLDGDIDADTAREEVARNTRRLARRQGRWFGPDERIRWIPGPLDGADVARAADDAVRALGAAA